MIKHILAMRSDTGELSLFDETDNFMASYRGGKWIADDVFEMRDIEQNFYHIEDDKEVLKIMDEARKILGKPLKQA